MNQNRQTPNSQFTLLGHIKTILTNIYKRRKRANIVNVYFIPGMCYNCKVFDKLALPSGFKKCYIEWEIPRPDETLSEYSRHMAKSIDRTTPFVLVGYSFGAVIIQEMARFLKPQKSIIISSFKSKSEIPTLFQAVKKTNIAEMISMKVYSATDFITNAFNKYVYRDADEDIAQFMTYTDPVYVKWAVVQITEWIPDCHLNNLYHIHGTEDQIFPFKQMHDVYPVEGGDHLMVYKKADKVSAILSSILLMP